MKKIFDKKIDYICFDLYTLMHLEYYFEKDLSKFSNQIIVISNDKRDAFIFNKLMDCTNLKAQFLVTKEVGNLFIENFNAKMRYKKMIGDKNE